MKSYYYFCSINNCVVAFQSEYADSPPDISKYKTITSIVYRNEITDTLTNTTYIVSTVVLVNSGEFETLVFISGDYNSEAIFIAKCYKFRDTVKQHLKAIDIAIAHSKTQKESN